MHPHSERGSVTRSSPETCFKYRQSVNYCGSQSRAPVPIARFTDTIRVQFSVFAAFPKRLFDLCSSLSIRGEMLF
jgi:hypothetical protein